MGLKQIFQEFIDHRRQLQVVYVATSDENGQPNCAPAIVIDIVKPNKVYYVDFKSSRTYANLAMNKQTSLAFLEEKSFLGLKLNGWSEVLEKGSEYKRLKNKLLSKINTYDAEQCIERVKGVVSHLPAEMTLPTDYVIIKFVANESKAAVGKSVGSTVSTIAALQARIDALEKSGARHKKAGQRMKVSRDFFKAQSESFEKLGMVDELTGLYDRHGFIVLAEQQLKVGRRNGKETFVIFGDIDHLKPINDTFGHAAGDKVLVDVAQILKKTFRDSDIVARIGGDEFAVVPVDCNHDTSARAVERLKKNLEKHNRDRSDAYRLELSTGIAFSCRDDPASLGDLLGRADQIMYDEKRKKS